MSGKNRWLVTDEPVEVGDSRRTTDKFKGIYTRIYLIKIKQNRKMSTCNLGFRITWILTNYAQKLPGR
jgi:hypothetical protein